VELEPDRPSPHSAALDGAQQSLDGDSTAQTEQEQKGFDAIAGQARMNKLADVARIAEVVERHRNERKGKVCVLPGASGAADTVLDEKNAHVVLVAAADAPAPLWFPKSVDCLAQDTADKAPQLVSAGVLVPEQFGAVAEYNQNAVPAARTAREAGVAAERAAFHG
jgi:hypothetical protein